MSSLSSRLLVSVSVLLLLFFGATVVVLDTAFRTAYDILGRRAEALLALPIETIDSGELSTHLKRIGALQ